MNQAKRRILSGLAMLFCLGSVPAQIPNSSAANPKKPQAALRSNGPGESKVPDSSSSAESVRVLLIPDGETTLSSPVTAKIKTLFASIGASVASGQVLVSFDCDEPVARLAMANAELAGAVESHEAKIRMQGLEQASDVEVALAASAAAKARGQVALQKAQIGQCNVAAPWSGRVSKVHVRNHMSVTPGQPMLELVKSGPLRLKMNIPSKSIGKFKTGTTIDIEIDETGKTYQARVQALNSRVDPVSQTIEIEAAISRYHPELLPGMSGVAIFNSIK